MHITGGYPVEPVDVHPDIRHLECLRDTITLTDKPYHAYSLGWKRIRDGIEMARIAPRADARAARARAVAVHRHQLELAARASTRRWPAGIIEMARAGQAVVMTPFTLAGAMAPVTVAGALAQQNAEALAGIALGQLVRPGAPMVYGGFTSNVDMKSGAPAFGTPEYMKAALVGGQLARRYGLPYRTSNANAANDRGRAGGLRVGAVALGGGDGRRQLRHARRRLARGRARRLVREDGDRRRPAADGGRVPQPLEVDARRRWRWTPSARSAPAATSSAAAHTQARYRTAFYAPMVSDWRNYESLARGRRARRLPARHRIW